MRADTQLVFPGTEADKGGRGRGGLKGFLFFVFSAGSLEGLVSPPPPFSSTPASWSGRSSAARARSSLRSPETNGQK